jgi:dTDP-4-amino-4,6-dideoxygalactose transaminase
MTELALFGGAPVVAPDAHRRWPIITEDERAAVARVLDRGVLSGMFAPEASALEREFAAFVGAAHAQLTHCGTSALQIALAAAGAGEGTEVIVPAYSFVATPLAVVLQGAVPVFVDVDPEHGNIDPRAVEAALTPRTRVVMPVHVHGCPCDLDEVMAVARKHDLAVVEDAAQAHGATYKGRPVGAIGAAGGFSLQSSKNLPGGEGGVFVTNSDELADVARSLRTFGQDVAASDAGAYDPGHPLDGHRALASVRIGSMYRGNELTAAFVRAQLARLPALTRRCQENAERLRCGLAELPGVHVPRVPGDRTSVHHKLRVHLDPALAGLSCSPRALRDATSKALVAEGLEVVLWQTEPLPAQPLFRGTGYGKGFPWTGAGGEQARAGYDAHRFPVTQRLLDGSIVLFSQSCPLIAQDAALVDRYVEAFAKVWARRASLVSSLVSSPVSGG